ncbi:MAG: SDR family oxidoreductase, partial [Longimicrobiales bacterium]
SGGIGLASARALAAAGANLVLIARGEERLRAAAESVGARAVTADVTTEEGVERVAAAVREAGAAAPDLLVNAAGSFALAPLAETDIAVFDAQLRANLRGPFLLMRRFLAGMLARGSGHIISIGSVAGRRAFPANGAYAASKFGLRGLHAVLAEELRGTGVRATLVEPAATDTPLWEPIDTTAPGLPSRAEMLAATAVADAVLYVATRPAGVAIPNLLVERG